jgi:glucose-1-phosphate thymidylyltransferase
MIYYPLNTLINAEITEIMIVSGRDMPAISLGFLVLVIEFGVSLTYEIQEKAGGIAEALGIAANWADDENVAVILADNIFQDDVKRMFLRLLEEHILKRNSRCTAIQSY